MNKFMRVVTRDTMPDMPTGRAPNGKDTPIAVFVPSHTPLNTLDDMMTWCHENTTESYITCMGGFRFCEESDAVMFVLRWA